MAFKSQAGLIKLIDAIECVEKCLSCAICLEISSDPVETRCGHLFCRNCIQKVLSNPGESCPICKFSLSRRGVSSSHQMGLCIRQLSELIAAIHSDSGIDVTSRLKTHYTKRAFLPSLCPPPPPSLQETQNQKPTSESDNHADGSKVTLSDLKESAKRKAKRDTEPSAESPISQTGQYTSNHLPCKLIPHTNKHHDLQNENLIPPETGTEGQESESSAAKKVHESRLDQSHDDSRQCLKDISFQNQNQAHWDQNKNTKTWSRVAKFGKELRRRSRAGLPKREKLCVTVRDKSAIPSSVDQENSDQGNVAHRNIDALLVIMPDDGVTCSDGQTKRTICEKANPETYNLHDENILKTKVKQPMINVNVDVNESEDEIVASGDNFAGKNRSNETTNENQFTEIGEKRQNLSLKTDLGKSEDRTDKQSLEHKGKAEDLPLTTDLGKSENRTNKLSVQHGEKPVDLVLMTDLRKPGNRTDKQLGESNGKSADVSLIPDLEKSECRTDRQLVVREEQHLGPSSKVNLGPPVNPANRLNEGNLKLSDLNAEKLPTVTFNSTRTTQAQNLTPQEPPRIKRMQYVNLPANVVHFKKLGHLFRTYKKKSVSFLYLGTLIPRGFEPNNDDGPLSICRLCASPFRPEESSFTKKSSLGSSSQVNRAKSFESSQKTHPLRKMCTAQNIDSDKKNERCERNNFNDRSSFNPIELAEETLLHQEGSPESLIAGRKRKRPESPDDTNQRFKKQNSMLASHDLSLIGTTKDPNDGNQHFWNQSTKAAFIALSCNQTSETPNNRNRHIKKHSPKPAFNELSCNETTAESDDAKQRFRIQSSKSGFNEVSCNQTTESVQQNCLPNAKPHSEYLPARCNNTTNAIEAWEHENESPDMMDVDFLTEKVLQEANATSGDRTSRISSQPTLLVTPDPSTAASRPTIGDLLSSKVIPLSDNRNDKVTQIAELKELKKDNKTYQTFDSMMDITGEEMLFRQFEENLFGPPKTGQNVGHRDGANEIQGEDEGGIDERKENADSSATNSNRCHDDQDFIELTPVEQTLARPNDPAEKRKSETETPKIVTPALTNAKRRPLYQSTPKSTTKMISPIANQKRNKVATEVSKKILCSGLTSKQTEQVRYFAALFKMQYTKVFSEDVTHVIVNTNNENNGAFKTLKYLQGVAYRKWVLSFGWIVDSVSGEGLMNEEPYEVVDSSTLVPGPRNSRTGEKGPFENFVFLCVEPFQNISLPDYEDLLRHTGATVVGSLSELAAESSVLKIIAIQAECHEKKIIEWHQITKAVPVAQEWVIECISQYRLVSFLPFLQELLPQDVLDIGFPEELVRDDADLDYEMPA